MEVVCSGEKGCWGGLRKNGYDVFVVWFCLIMEGVLVRRKREVRERYKGRVIRVDDSFYKLIKELSLRDEVSILRKSKDLARKLKREEGGGGFDFRI